MDLSLAGVVILYNPDDAVFENLKSYAPFLQMLYVIDNSERINEPLITKIKAHFPFSISRIMTTWVFPIL